MTTELNQIINKSLEDKIVYLQQLINDLRQSNNETKSSMGDKYETSREMIQQEITRIQNQLNEVLDQRDYFHKLNIKTTGVIKVGSYVETSLGNFCIAISLGDLNYKSKKVFVLSPVTPLAKLLIGKQASDSFELNGKQIEIYIVE